MSRNDLYDVIVIGGGAPGVAGGVAMMALLAAGLTAVRTSKRADRIR